MKAATQERNGFSLIEVLIAVLVLAIGMLGLGAVFPAIIAEQRDSFEVVEGENASSAAAALITNREFVNFSLLSEDFNRPDLNGARYSHEWVVPQDGLSFYGWTTPMPAFNFQTGLWSYNFNDSNVNPTIDIVRQNPELGQIPVGARLYPQPYSGKDPRFVWDLALRREPGGDRVQAAIFVRRIDARVRVPTGYSLSDVLTGSNGVPGGQRLPVAIDPNTGRPVADDGNNKFYANIQMLEVEVHPERLDWLVIPDDQPIGSDFADTSIDLATSSGQKLVDNTGVVRTVIGLAELGSDDDSTQLRGRGRVVVVDPPFAASNAGGSRTDRARPSDSGTNNDPDWDDERASWVRQVIFTPRTPVAVRIVTLEDDS